MKIKILNALALLAPSTIFLFTSCGDSEENKRLRTENDSLRQELDTRYSVVSTMREVKLLIDSIDDSRNALHYNLKEGTQVDDVTSRLANINDYVKRTESKLQGIQSELKKTKSHASAYMLMAEALQDELSIRTAEIEELQTQMDTYQKQNKGLIKTVKLQETELVEMRTQLTTKKQELSLIEAKVDEMVTNFKVSEADAYFQRAAAVEEAAKRTKLAPTKKKETYREALELYKKAFELGKTEAKDKISELEKKVN